MLLGVEQEKEKLLRSLNGLETINNELRTEVQRLQSEVGEKNKALLALEKERYIF